MTDAPLLEVEDLSRHYGGGELFGSGRGSRKRALDGVSFTMAAGEILGIVGESGCGKSTLARLVMALDRPTGGRVLLDGEPLLALRPRALAQRRRDLQMVFQDPYGSLDPRQTVGRIVSEPLHLLVPRLGRAERAARVDEMLAAVGLGPEAAGRYPHQFSGGQRQRIAIARALITAPKLVVADEPVSALDLSVQAQVLNLILDLNRDRGTAFLFISHNLGVVQAIADRVSVMYRGRIVETGPAASVFAAPRHPYTALLVAAEPVIAERRDHGATAGNRSTRQAVWRTGPAARFATAARGPARCVRVKRLSSTPSRASRPMRGALPQDRRRPPWRAITRYKEREDAMTGLADLSATALLSGFAAGPSHRATSGAPSRTGSRPSSRASRRSMPTIPRPPGRRPRLRPSAGGRAKREGGSTDCPSRSRNSSGRAACRCRAAAPRRS